MQNNSTQTLQGKVCFVTGGSRGIGRAIVTALADAGADVAFTYQASKDLALALANCLQEKGVTVNAIAPGFIETDMVSAMPEAALAQVKAMTPVGRLGKPEEVADAVVFLASGRSGYITGQVLGVNGGMYM